MNDECPNSKSSKHYFLNQPIVRSDFEPVSYGETAEATLYRRVEYTIALCSCGLSTKQKVRMVNE